MLSSWASPASRLPPAKPRIVSPPHQQTARAASCSLSLEHLLVRRPGPVRRGEGGALDAQDLVEIGGGGAADHCASPQQFGILEQLGVGAAQVVGVDRRRRRSTPRQQSARAPWSPSRLRRAPPPTTSAQSRERTVVHARLAGDHFAPRVPAAASCSRVRMTSRSSNAPPVEAAVELTAPGVEHRERLFPLAPPSRRAPAATSRSAPTPRASHSPLATLRPTRTPVNDPGPCTTPTAVQRLRDGGEQTPQRWDHLSRSPRAPAATPPRPLRAPRRAPAAARSPQVLISRITGAPPPVPAARRRSRTDGRRSSGGPPRPCGQQSLASRTPAACSCWQSARRDR